MARTPSCYLYLSFLIHLSAFSSLIAGYVTPYWTMAKMATGKERSLGLLYTCHRVGCDLIHVTEVRMVFLIVFGMCTGSLVLSFFLMQTFCLALCNNSCRAKNMGTGLSYFSVINACVLGAAMTLYQIDLAEEDRPGVTSLKIGWSRYAMYGAAGGFLLGGVLNVADSVRRNRLNKLDVIRKAETRNKMISMLEKNRLAQMKGPCAGSGPSGSDPSAKPVVPGGGGADFKGKRLSLTVDAAVKLAAAKKDLEKHLHGPTRKTDRVAPEKSSGVILVNEAVTKFNGRDNDKGAAKASPQPQRQQQEQSQSQRPKRQQQDLRKAATAAVLEEARKARLLKAGHVESIEGKPQLPSVEEETENELEQSKRAEIRRLIRESQGAGSVRGATGGSEASRVEALHNKKSIDYSPSVEHAWVKPRSEKKVLKMEDSTESDSALKYVVKKSDNGERKDREKETRAETKKASEKVDRLVLEDEPPKPSRGRRGSAVEDALANVSSFLEQMTRTGPPPKRLPSIEGDGQGVTNTVSLSADNTPRPQRRNNNLDRLSLTSELSLESSSLEKGGKKELPPVRERKTFQRDDSTRRSLDHSSSIRRQETVDSQKSEVTSISIKPETKNQPSSSSELTSLKEKSKSDENKTSKSDTFISSKDSKQDGKYNADSSKSHDAVQKQLTEEQIKRNQIVETMSRNKEKKRKRITQ